MAAKDPFPLNIYSWVLPYDMQGSVLKLIDDGTLPDPKILFSGLLLGFVFTLVRLVLNVILFDPIAYRAMGLKRIAKKDSILDLDKIYNPKQRPTADQLKLACEQVGIPIKEGEKYLRLKRQEKTQCNKIWKFSEASWRASLYAFMVIVGIYFTCWQPWFSAPFSNTWKGWPYQRQPIETYWYYSLCMGVYIHLVIFQAFDTKRGDFWQQVLHHVVTLLLITMSWVTNFVRIGTLVILLHDLSDIPLEFAKIINYTKSNPAHTKWASPAADVVFGFFSVIFFVTRLCMYPYYILYNTLFVVEKAVEYPGGPPPRPPIYWIFNGMLLVLQGLHIFWFYLISKMIYKVIVLKKLEDIRSDDEGDWEETKDKTK